MLNTPKPSPWRHDENGLRFHIIVPDEYHTHSTQYIAGYMKGYLKRKENLKRRPAEARRRGILG
jgi:hypothetical protein